MSFKNNTSSRTPERPPYHSVEMESNRNKSAVSSKLTPEQPSYSVERTDSARTSVSEMSLSIKRYKDREGFKDRFNQALDQIAEDGIQLALPFMVLDHVAINQQNLGMITNWVRRCANTGTTITNKGIELLKVKEVNSVVETKEGATKQIKVWIIVIKCQDLRAHHMIYDHLNQKNSHKMRMGAYVFDQEGTRYPDKSTTDETIDSEVLLPPKRVNTNPILFDFTEGYREERTSAPRRHNRGEIPGLPTNFQDVQLPDYFKKMSNSTSIGYLSMTASEPSISDRSTWQDRRIVQLPLNTQTPERPSHSVEKGNQRREQADIRRTIIEPTHESSRSRDYNNKRRATDQDSFANDDRDDRKQKQQRRSPGWEGRGE